MKIRSMAVGGVVSLVLSVAACGGAGNEDVEVSSAQAVSANDWASIGCTDGATDGVEFLTCTRISASTPLAKSIGVMSSTGELVVMTITEVTPTTAKYKGAIEGWCIDPAKSVKPLGAPIKSNPPRCYFKLVGLSPCTGKPYPLC